MATRSGNMDGSNGNRVTGRVGLAPDDGRRIAAARPSGQRPPDAPGEPLKDGARGAERSKGPCERTIVAPCSRRTTDSFTLPAAGSGQCPWSARTPQRIAPFADPSCCGWVIVLTDPGEALESLWRWRAAFGGAGVLFDDGYAPGRVDPDRLVGPSLHGEVDGQMSRISLRSVWIYAGPIAWLGRT